MSTRRLVALLTLAIPLLGAGIRAVVASPTVAERSLIAASRETLAARCPCESFTSRRAYVRCVEQAMHVEVSSGTLPRKRMHDVMTCALRSTCGRPGKVTCCRTNRRGRTRCAITAAARCRAPRGGTACATGASSWCDAIDRGCAPAGIETQDVNCCVPEETGLVCESLKPSECITFGGTNVGGDGTCTPDPCIDLPTTTTTTATLPTTTTVTVTTTTSTTTTTVAGFCGDTIVQPELGEECDPPWSRNSAQCPPRPGFRFGAECQDNCRCGTVSTTTTTTPTSSTTTTTTTPASSTTTTTLPVSVVTLVVSLTHDPTSTGDVSGVEIAVGYSPAKVAIPGSGEIPLTSGRLTNLGPGDAIFSASDRDSNSDGTDDELFIPYGFPGIIPPGELVRVLMDGIDGEVTVDDFTCTVLNAVDIQAVPLAGVTCAVSLNGTSTTTTTTVTTSTTTSFTPTTVTSTSTTTSEVPTTTTASSTTTTEPATTTTSSTTTTTGEPATTTTGTTASTTSTTTSTTSSSTTTTTATSSTTTSTTTTTTVATTSTTSSTTTTTTTAPTTTTTTSTSTTTTTTLGAGVCGDGLPGAGEECDDGNDLNIDACTNLCKNATCGDNFTWQGVEECDDGNVDEHVCLNTCHWTPAVCGDTFRQFGETCDDGNQLDGDVCPSDCNIASCNPSGNRVQVSVNYASTATVGGLVVLLKYPDGTVGLPGLGNATSVRGRITNLPTGFTHVANELDYALRETLAAQTQGTAIPPGLIFRASFDLCFNATAPGAGAFTCTVLGASTPAGVDIDLGKTSVTCSVTVP